MTKTNFNLLTDNEVIQIYSEYVIDANLIFSTILIMTTVNYLYLLVIPGNHTVNIIFALAFSIIFIYAVLTYYPLLKRFRKIKRVEYENLY